MPMGGAACRSIGWRSEPSIATSSSLTILTTIWPGVTERSTSAPTALALTFSVKSLTTSSATSASSSARRTSRIASTTSLSVSAPRRVSLSRTPERRSVSDWNILYARGEVASLPADPKAIGAAQRTGGLGRSRRCARRSDVVALLLSSRRKAQTHPGAPRAAGCLPPCLPGFRTHVQGGGSEIRAVGMAWVWGKEGRKSMPAVPVPTAGHFPQPARSVEREMHIVIVPSVGTDFGVDVA